MSLHQQITDRLAVLKAAQAGGTPGPWDRQWYGLAGVDAAMFGKGHCAYCRTSAPTWKGRTDINGTVMAAHEHVLNGAYDGAIYAGVPGDRVCVVNTTDEYGQASDADLDLIVTARNLLPGLIAAAEDALAAHPASEPHPIDGLRYCLGDHATKLVEADECAELLRWARALGGGE
jgi:hypothetical protein